MPSLPDGSLGPGDRLGLTRMTIYASFQAPRNQVIMMKTGNLVMHPAMYMVLNNNGRTPLYTRYMLGAREVERDRRKYGHQKTSRK